MTIHTPNTASMNWEEYFKLGYDPATFEGGSHLTPDCLERMYQAFKARLIGEVSATDEVVEFRLINKQDQK